MTQVFMPDSLPSLLSAIQDDAPYRLMAGGTDVMVELRATAEEPARLICLERVPELQGIHLDGTDIVIGAATPLQRISDHPLVAGHLPLLRQAIHVLGAPPIVHMATLGGNICTASPAGDTIPPLHVLSAELELESSAGARRAAISDFIVAPRRTILRHGEVLARIRIRIPKPGTRAAYFKVGRRKAQAISVVSLAASFTNGAGANVEDIHLAWGSVGPVVMTFPQIETSLRGQQLSDDLLRHAGALVEQLVDPIDDIRASAAYRRRVSGNLLRRLPEIGGPLS